MRVMIRTNNIN